MQVGLGTTAKQSFRLGIRRYNPNEERLSADPNFDLCWFPRSYMDPDGKEVRAPPSLPRS